MTLRKRVRSFLGAGRRRILCSFERREFALGDHGPIVSFTFDDFPRSALLSGGAVLEKHGVRGTYYTAPGLMNGSTECGEQFRSEDLDALVERGHELASHTYRHISSRKEPCAAFCRDVEQGQSALEAATGVSAPNFAYPFGDVTLASKRTLISGANGRVVSARGIVPGLNGPVLDLNMLRANGLYGDLDRLPQAENLIAENTRQKTWLIFYTHDVAPSPSPYGCTAGLLDRVVSAAIQSRVRVLTVGDALRKIGAQPESGDFARLKIERAEVCEI